MKKRLNSTKKIKQLLKNKTILVTGGSGSIGTALTKKLLEFPVSAVRVLDINEYTLFKLKRSVNDERLRVLLGSIQDMERVEIAANGVDIIIHAAAIKNIEISEFNPIETINTNINGIINLIKLAIKNKLESFLNISTDKAANSTTLYGDTKQLSEKLTSWAGSVTSEIKFGSVRFANVFETRGNVFEIWKEELKNNRPLSITHPSMKRYFFHMDDAVNFILESLSIINKGEVIVPKMKSYMIKELAEKYSKKHKIIGLRKGEKMEEILLTEEEKSRAKNERTMWIIKQDLL